MTRRPARDESLIVPPEIRPGGSERIFIVELARYLNHCNRTLRRIARRNGWLHNDRQWPTRKRVFWVTPYAAARLISFARSAQGEQYMAGKDFHAWRHKVLERRRRGLAGERAKRDAAKAREQITLAILGSGTEDKPSGGSDG